MIWSYPLQVNSVLGPKTTWGLFKPGAWVASLCPETAQSYLIQYLFLNHFSVVWSATSHCSPAAYSSQHESVRSICISIGLAWKTVAHASVNRSWTGAPLNQRFRGQAPSAAAYHFYFSKATQKVLLAASTTLRVISIKFPLVISMLCKTGWSWELRTWSRKMTLLDILSTSPHYFCRKWIGVSTENSNFDLRV